MNLDSQLEQLETAQLVRHLVEEEPAYMFRHTLTQETAYDSLLKNQRREIHRAVALAYEKALGAPNQDDYAAILARHYSLAGDDVNTLRYAAQAAEIAARVYANAEAVDNYSLAIDAAERLDTTKPEQLVQLYTQRGRALELAGQDQAALKSYERLGTLSRERSQPELLLGSLMLCSKLYALHTKLHDSARGEELSLQALALAQQLDDRNSQVRILWNLMLSNQWGARGPQVAVEYGERALTLARQWDLREPLAYTLSDLAYPYMYLGQADRAVAVRLEANQVWHELGNKPMTADNLTGLANVYLNAGKIENALTAAREALEISESIGNDWGQSYSLGIIGSATIELAHWDDAAESLLASQEHSHKVGAMGPIIATCMFLADLYSLVGDYLRALEFAQTGQAFATAHLKEWVSWTNAVLARVYLAESELGSAAKAVATLPKSIEEIFDKVWVRGAVIAVIARLELALAQRDFSHTLEHCEQLLETITRRGMFASTADVLHVKGKIHIGQGDMDNAGRVLHQAREAARSTKSRRAQLGILITLAQFERGRGNLAQAESAAVEASGLVRYMLEHMHRPDLREPFLQQPAIRSILQSVESFPNE